MAADIEFTIHVQGREFTGRQAGQVPVMIYLDTRNILTGKHCKNRYSRRQEIFYETLFTTCETDSLTFD